MKEPILVYLQRQLRAAGRKTWTAIEAETGVKEPLIRKLAYADRPNPGVAKVQPLLDFFWAVDRGERKLPKPKAKVSA